MRCSCTRERFSSCRGAAEVVVAAAGPRRLGDDLQLAGAGPELEHGLPAEILLKRGSLTIQASGIEIVQRHRETAEVLGAHGGSDIEPMRAGSVRCSSIASDPDHLRRIEACAVRRSPYRSLGWIFNEGEETQMNEPQDAVVITSDRGAGGTGDVVQIKVKLRAVSKPAVWRRLLVEADTRLDRLHEVIVAAFGWQGYHMHVFTSGRDEFGLPDPELGFIDERRVSLGELIGGAGDRLRYTYDFGDDWEHEILVEELLDADPEIDYPVLLAAKGACPPEDCGGPWGYAELKEILADLTHDQHQEMLDWLGLDEASAFDPSGLDLDRIEEELALSGAGS